MPVKLNAPAAESEVETETNDPLTQPGFHVLGNGQYCGTFIDREQAEAYVEGQLLPQEGMKGEIVEGPAAAVE